MLASTITKTQYEYLRWVSDNKVEKPKLELRFTIVLFRFPTLSGDELSAMLQL